jgi:hypothetical protein
LPGGRTARCSLLNQQAFRLEKEFEVDHGFHRTPLIPGRLEALLRGHRGRGTGRMPLFVSTRSG